MGYTARHFRGYLSGLGAAKPTSVATATLAVTGAATSASLVTTGNVTAARHLASSLGTAGAPAFAATTALDGGLYWISTSLTAISAGGAAFLYGSNAQTVINMPGYFASYVDIVQVATPAAPGATVARLFAVDAGASKNRISAIFDSGAAQTMATEP